MEGPQYFVIRQTMTGNTKNLYVTVTFVLVKKVIIRSLLEFILPSCYQVINVEYVSKDILKTLVYLSFCLYFSHRLKSLPVNTDYKIIKAPSDGHCMIHAWAIALENSREIQNKPKYKQLWSLIDHEFRKNNERYKNFISNTTNFAEEVYKYLQHRNYASEVGDMVLQALANVTEISAMIYTEGGEGIPVKSSIIEPISGQSNGLINLLKKGQHYDVIVWGKTGEES